MTKKFGHPYPPDPSSEHLLSSIAQEVGYNVVDGQGRTARWTYRGLTARVHLVGDGLEVWSFEDREHLQRRSFSLADPACFEQMRQHAHEGWKAKRERRNARLRGWGIRIAFHLGGAALVTGLVLYVYTT